MVGSCDSPIVIAGMHSLRAALNQGAGYIQLLWYDLKRQDQRITELLTQAVDLKIPTRGVDRTMLDRLAGDANHQGVVAQIAKPATLGETDLEQLIKDLPALALCLVLDGIQDPHNLGACLRTADAAGVHIVISPKDRSVGITPSVCKVASGAAGRVPYVQVTNLARTLRMLKEHGLWLVGASGDAASNFYQASLPGPALALIVGGERKGLRRLTKEHCDLLVSLPMLGVVESLNVSVATGVLLYEIMRQRRAGGTHP